LPQNPYYNPQAVNADALLKEGILTGGDWLGQGVQKILDAAGWLQNQYKTKVPPKVQDFVEALNKNVIDPISQSPIGGPEDKAVQGVMEAVTMLPLLLKRKAAGEMISKTGEKLLELYREKVPLPVQEKLGDRKFINLQLQRNQQEQVDFPVTQGARGMLFSLPYTGKKANYYVKNDTSASEGGSKFVQFNYEAKNPMFLRRTGEFIGPHAAQVLGGQEVAGLDLVDYIADPNTIKRLNTQINNYREAARNPNTTKEDLKVFTQEANKLERRLQRHNLLSAIVPKDQLEAIARGRDPHVAIKEAIASRLGNKAGYDAVIAHREANSSKPLQPNQIAIIDNEYLKTARKQLEDISIKKLQKKYPGQDLTKVINSINGIKPKENKQNDLQNLINNYETPVNYITDTYNNMVGSHEYKIKELDKFLDKFWPKVNKELNETNQDANELQDAPAHVVDDAWAKVYPSFTSTDTYKEKYNKINKYLESQGYNPYYTY